MAGAIGAFAVPPAIGAKLAIVPVAQKRIVVLAGFQDDAATGAAIPARGAAARDEFFAAKGDTPVASVTGLDVNFRFVNKHEDFRQQTQDGTGAGSARRYAKRELRSRLVWIVRSPFPQTSCTTKAQSFLC